MHMNRSYKSSRSEAAAVPVSHSWQLLIIIGQRTFHTLSPANSSEQNDTPTKLCVVIAGGMCAVRANPEGRRGAGWLQKQSRGRSKQKPWASSHSSDCDREAWVRTQETVEATKHPRSAENLSSGSGLAATELRFDLCGRGKTKTGTAERWGLEIRLPATLLGVAVQIIC